MVSAFPFPLLWLHYRTFERCCQLKNRDWKLSSPCWISRCLSSLRISPNLRRGFSDLRFRRFQNLSEELSFRVSSPVLMRRHTSLFPGIQHPHGWSQPWVPSAWQFDSLRRLKNAGICQNRHILRNQRISNLRTTEADFPSSLLEGCRLFCWHILLQRLSA